MGLEVATVEMIVHVVTFRGGGGGVKVRLKRTRHLQSEFMAG